MTKDEENNGPGLSRYAQPLRERSDKNPPVFRLRHWLTCAKHNASGLHLEGEDVLRVSITEDLRQLLDHPPFLVRDDFSIGATKTNLGVVVLLTYQIGDGEFFKATIPTSKEKRSKELYQPDEFKISCEFNPGEVSTKEFQTFWGVSELQEAVLAWCKRIAEDVSRAPSVRMAQEQVARIEELEQKISSIPDSYATAEQAAKIQNWIAEVERDLKDRIEKMEIDSKAKQVKLDELAAEFEGLKQRVHSSKMKNIFRAIGVRFLRVACDPKLAHLIENGSKLAGLITDGMSKF